MPFRTRAAVAGAVLATAAGLLFPATAGARPADRPAPDWSAAPAPGGGARPTAQDRPYFYLEGDPGAVMNDRLSLGNPTGRTVTVRLRGADTGDGTEDGGDGRRDGSGAGPGEWAAFAAKEVRIPPRTRASVPFTVTVPRDALPGDHPGALAATGPGGSRSVPVHLRVSGPTLSAVTVEDVSVERRGSAAVIRYTLVNRGNTVLAPRLAVRADGLFGQVLHRAARTLPVELAPGRRVERTESWPDPPALDMVGVRLDVTAAGAATSSAGAGYTAVPWVLVVAAVVVVAGSVGGRVLLRRRRAAPGAGPPDGESAEVAADERELASTGSGARS